MCGPTRPAKPTAARGENVVSCHTVVPYIAIPLFTKDTFIGQAQVHFVALFSDFTSTVIVSLKRKELNK